MFPYLRDGVHFVSESCLNDMNDEAKLTEIKPVITEFALPVGAYVYFAPSFRLDRGLSFSFSWKDNRHYPNVLMEVNREITTQLLVNSVTADADLKITNCFKFLWYADKHIRDNTYREYRPLRRLVYPNVTFVVSKTVHEYNDEPFEQYTCLGAAVFGLWDVEFRYDIFNPKTNKTEPRIIPYPHTFFIRPRRQWIIRDAHVATLPSFTHS
jgi:hypothetical protein